MEQKDVVIQSFSDIEGWFVGCKSSALLHCILSILRKLGVKGCGDVLRPFLITVRYICIADKNRYRYKLAWKWWVQQAHWRWTSTIRTRIKLKLHYCYFWLDKLDLHCPSMYFSQSKKSLGQILQLKKKPTQTPELLMNSLFTGWIHFLKQQQQLW